ncbi:(Fe-S)-binding protein [Thermodesulfatator indicus]
MLPEEIKQKLLRCIKCGNCMAVCPVFYAELKESAVARGKIFLSNLFLEKDEIDNKTLDIIYNCLICLSCVEVCPSNVGFGKTAIAIRHLISERKSFPLIKKGMFFGLKNPGLLKTGLKLLNKFTPLFFDEKEQVLTSKLKKDAFMPKFPSKDLRSMASNFIKKHSQDYLFFTGCSLNFFYPSIGEAVLKIFEINGIDIVLPEEHICCGTPMMVHGELKTAKELAMKNLELFERYNPKHIVTACASCTNTLKNEYLFLFKDDSEKLKLAEKWSKKIIEFSQFLSSNQNLKEFSKKLSYKVTYHDPCHLKKGLKIYQEPRKILNQIRGISFIEMENADFCCGNGGSYYLFYPDVSFKILEKKVSSIENSGANIVVTTCPACILQLSEGAIKFNKTYKVKHLAEIVLEAYGS